MPQKLKLLHDNVYEIPASRLVIGFGAREAAVSLTNDARKAPRLDTLGTSFLHTFVIRRKSSTFYNFLFLILLSKGTSYHNASK